MLARVHELESRSRRKLAGGAGLDMKWCWGGREGGQQCERDWWIPTEPAEPDLQQQQEEEEEKQQRRRRTQKQQKQKQQQLRDKRRNEGIVDSSDDDSSDVGSSDSSEKDCSSDDDSDDLAACDHTTACSCTLGYRPTLPTTENFVEKRKQQNYQQRNKNKNKNKSKSKPVDVDNSKRTRTSTKKDDGDGDGDDYGDDSHGANLPLIDNHIWIGNSSAATTRTWLSNRNIKHILNVTEKGDVKSCFEDELM